MIIFNLWAIPVGLLIFVLIQAVEWIYPGVRAEASQAVVFGAITTVVGGITEIFGIKGRVFFLPIWLVGIGILCYQLGWVGMIPFTGVAAFAVYLLWQGGAKLEQAQWQKAQETVRIAPTPPFDAADPEYWEWVKTALALPIGAGFTREMCEHDLKVLQAMTTALVSPSPAEASVLEEMRMFLHAAKFAPEAPRIDMKLRDGLADLIEAQLKKARKTRRAAGTSIPADAPNPGTNYR